MLFRNEKIDNTLFRLTLAAFLLTIVVVVLGAFTRLVDAGLGCPDWPGCYGHLLWPDEAHVVVDLCVALKERGACVRCPHTCICMHTHT